MIQLAIFASGSGTNAEAICKYFMDKKDIDVRLILTNKADAGVLDRAQRLGIDALVFEKNEMESADWIQQLKNLPIDYIILAGFLLKIPVKLIQAFPDRILNIHPALLPKYGGKGMYGHHVHNAVIEEGENESGISIHLVNEEYDRGRILFQESLEVLPGDTADSLALRIHVLEHTNYPRVIEEYIHSSI